MADEATSEATSTQTTEAPGATETAQNDPLSFFKADVLPEEHRENWTKGFDSIKTKLSEYEATTRSLGEKAGFWDELSEVPGFGSLIQALLDGKVSDISALLAPPKAEATTAPAPKPASAPAGVDPNEWADMKAAKAAWEDGQREGLVMQRMASLLNEEKEKGFDAREMMKDPKVRDTMLELTSDENGWSLEAAYHYATRDAHLAAMMKKKESKPAPQPEDGTSARTPENKSKRTLEDILRANFAKMESSPEDL